MLLGTNHGAMINFPLKNTISTTFTFKIYYYKPSRILTVATDTSTDSNMATYLEATIYLKMKDKSGSGNNENWFNMFSVVIFILMIVCAICSSTVTCLIYRKARKKYGWKIIQSRWDVDDPNINESRLELDWLQSGDDDYLNFNDDQYDIHNKDFNIGSSYPNKSKSRNTQKDNKSTKKSRNIDDILSPDIEFVNFKAITDQELYPQMVVSEIPSETNIKKKSRTKTSTKNAQDLAKELFSSIQKSNLKVSNNDTHKERELD